MTVLPRVLKEKSPTELLGFESGFEKIGVPALIIQVITGVWLAHNLMPDMGMWFNAENSLSCLIYGKARFVVTHRSICTGCTTEGYS
ncbi:MAG: hypothetical protein QX197_10690 [Methylococcaceae bacterium]